MAPNNGGDPLASILGPMGSHSVKQMGEKITMPQNSNFRLPSSIFAKKRKLSLWCQITEGTP